MEKDGKSCLSSILSPAQQQKLSSCKMDELSLCPASWSSSIALCGFGNSAPAFLQACPGFHGHNIPLSLLLPRLCCTGAPLLARQSK